MKTETKSADSPDSPYPDRLRAIRTKLGQKRELSQDRFAELLGVSHMTIKRLERGDNLSDYFINQMRERLPAALPYLLGTESELPVSLSVPGTLDDDDEHEGKALRSYLKRHDITQTTLAAKLGESLPSVGHKLHVRTFRPDVRENIARALGVAEDVIWGGRKLSRASAGEFALLPRIAPRQREGLTRSRLESLLSAPRTPDAPGLEATPVEGLSAAERSRALVLEIDTRDNMGPVLRDGAKVLALLVDEADYDSLPGGYVAVNVPIGPRNQLLVRKIASNRLREADTLDLVALDGVYGGALSVRRSDINYLLRLVTIVKQDLD